SAIVLAETLTGKEVRRWPAHVRFVGPLAFAPDGKTLASSGSDGRIAVWEVGSARRVHSISKAGVNTLAFSSDSRRFMSAITERSVSGTRRPLGASRAGRPSRRRRRSTPTFESWPFQTVKK